jgi:hypothetical protein
LDELFRSLVKYELLVYAFLGLTAIIPLRQLWKAWREWRISVFGLEKELSFQQLRRWGALVILLLMLGLSQFCLVTFVVPFLPAATFLLTPTANLLETPLPALTSNSLAANQTGTPAPPPGTTGCLPGQLIITSPTPGQELSGIVHLIGIIKMNNFGFYKYEFAPQGSDQWSTIAAGDKLNPDNKPGAWELGPWNTALLTPGDYKISLVVTDNLGNLLTPCIVPVRVVAPTPTP